MYAVTQRTEETPPQREWLNQVEAYQFGDFSDEMSRTLQDRTYIFNVDCPALICYTPMTD